MNMAKSTMKTVSGGVVAPQGFLCAGVSCGIKTRKNALDLGIILSTEPSKAAGVFTTNRVASATVTVDREQLRSRMTRGVVVNAGNANACTGAQGLKNARRMTALASECCGAAPREFLVASTGVIGHPLPMKTVEAGIRKASKALGRSARHNQSFAEAIMTTDLVPKFTAVQFTVGGKTVRIGGAAKGSGMIAPNMATMLGFITTDCVIAKPLLRKALRDTAAVTFNCTTVDGDCSTNDTIALLANGAAGNPPIRMTGKHYDLFHQGLMAICEHLAKAIAADGEGATRFIEVMVTGAHTSGDADKVARKIANSPLVKTAVNGGDPNWGRIICAAGYSGARVNADRMRLKINGVTLFRHGGPARVRANRLAACMKPKEICIHLDLGQGKQSAKLWTCDLSKEYISINAEYHT